MNREKVIDRIRKLLALTKSPNKPEAASAKKLAAALKRRHKVTAKEIAAVDPYTKIEAEPSGADPYWRERLSEAVAGRHRCIALRKDGRIFFEGKHADKAARMHRCIACQIVAECQHSWNTSAGGMEGSLYLVWSTTFKAEAVRAIAKKLAGVRAEAPSTASVADATPTSTEIIPTAKAQLAKASREVKTLVQDLATGVGDWMASILAADLVRKAAEAGRRFGLTVYLGDEPLLAEKVRRPQRKSSFLEIPFHSDHFKSLGVSRCA